MRERREGWEEGGRDRRKGGGIGGRGEGWEEGGRIDRKGVEDEKRWVGD